MKRKGNSEYWECRIKEKYPIGTRRGRLTVVGYEHSLENEGSWLLVCKCSCGKKKLIKRADHFQSGRVKSCGCLWNELLPQFGNRIAKKSVLPAGEAVIRFLWRNYHQMASERELDFSISEERFRELIFLPCKYCGRPPFNIVRVKGRIGSVTCNGIDRVNNSEGYTEKNSVPCCKVCNRAKRDMAVEEFYRWLKIVTTHLFNVTY